LGTTLTAAGVFVAAGVILYALVRASLLTQFDQSLLDKARLLASTVERERGGLDFEFDDIETRALEAGDPPAYLQLWLADGSTLYKSPALGQADLRRPVDRPVSPCWRHARLPDGQPGRAVQVTFLPRSEHDEHRGDAQSTAAGTVTLALARSTGSIDQTLIGLKSLLLLVGVGAVVASTAVLGWFVRRSLRPITALANEIDRLGERDLSKRIHQRRCPVEIQPVIDRLNDLLGRLNGAFQRERTFSASIAHELRNPLAGLLLKLDVTASRERQPRDYEESLRECRRITVRMQTMVEKLLSLARLEADRFEVRRDCVCLEELLRQLWTPLDAKADQRRLRLQWSLEPDLTLVSDVSLLTIALDNVLENAVSYADDGGTVHVATCSSPAAANVSVANSGSQLSQAEAEHALEQFWRGDAARREPGVHCGLGLSLVGKIASVLEGSVSVRSQRDRDFSITIALPRSTRPPTPKS
jgi:signal transduction histidine kinase